MTDCSGTGRKLTRRDTSLARAESPNFPRRPTSRAKSKYRSSAEEPFSTICRVNVQAAERGHVRIYHIATDTRNSTTSGPKRRCEEGPYPRRKAASDKIAFELFLAFLGFCQRFSLSAPGICPFSAVIRGSSKPSLGWFACFVLRFVLCSGGIILRHRVARFTWAIRLSWITLLIDVQVTAAASSNPFT